MAPVIPGSLWTDRDGNGLYKVIKVNYDGIVFYASMCRQSYTFVLSDYGFRRFYRLATKLEVCLNGL